MSGLAQILGLQISGQEDPLMDSGIYNSNATDRQRLGRVGMDSPPIAAASLPARPIS